MRNILLTSDSLAGGTLPSGGNQAGGIDATRGDSPGGGKFLIFAYDYPKSGNSGGWSKSAKHKPQPVVVTGEMAGEGEFPGGRFPAKPMAGGKVRRKFTAFDMSTTPPTLLRRDYSLDDLRKLGVDIPKLYFDEIGNIRGQSDDLVMQGPSAWGPETFVK